jgi:hypothetical protein
MYGANIPTSIRAGRLSNRERRRRADEAIEIGTKAVLTTLVLLAQKGGEITVTQGTLQQCMANLDNLDYIVEPNPKVPGEFIVRLIEGNKDNENRRDAGADVPAETSVSVELIGSTGIGSGDSATD